MKEEEKQVSITDIINLDNNFRMSTLDIAEQTGKDHRHVLRDARRMLVALNNEEGLSNFGQSYKNAQGKEQPYYLLPEKELFTLITGYSIKLREKIIEQWLFLKKQERQKLMALIEEGRERKYEQPEKNMLTMQNLEKDLLVIEKMAKQLDLSKKETAIAYYNVNVKHGLTTEYFGRISDVVAPRVSRSLAYLFEKHGWEFKDDFFHDTRELYHDLAKEKGMLLWKTYECTDAEGDTITLYKYRLIGEGFKYMELKPIQTTPDKMVQMIPFYYEDTFLDFNQKIHPTWEEVMGPETPMRNPFGES